MVDTKNYKKIKLSRNLTIYIKKKNTSKTNNTPRKYKKTTTKPQKKTLFKKKRKARKFTPKNGIAYHGKSGSKNYYYRDLEGTQYQNTKDIMADARYRALPPGKRVVIHEDGRVTYYYEYRSNRSDRRGNVPEGKRL